MDVPQSKPEPSDNSSVQVSKPDRLPSIGVLDLLILITCLGVVFSFQEKMAKFGWLYPTDNQLFQLISRLIVAIQSGIPLAATFWLIKQKRITGQFFWQPGHWILFAFCVSTAFMMICLPFLQVDERQLAGDSNAISLFFGFINIVTSIIFLVAAFSFPWRWRGVFLAYFASNTMFVVRLLVFASAASIASLNWLTPIEWIANVTQFVSFVCLVTALIMDLVQRKRRDWLHWAGILVFANVVVANPVLTFVYVRYFLSINGQ